MLLLQFDTQIAQLQVVEAQLEGAREEQEGIERKMFESEEKCRLISLELKERQGVHADVSSSRLPHSLRYICDTLDSVWLVSASLSVASVHWITLNVVGHVRLILETYYTPYTLTLCALTLAIPV